MEELLPKSLLLFKEVQEMAFEAARHVHSKLQIGMSEKEAAELMRQFLLKKGVNQYFHLPFAWFGERTKFADFSRPLPFLQKKTFMDFKFPKMSKKLPNIGVEFLPTDKKLEDNMAVILDVAPALYGAAADIGYSCYFGKSAAFDKAMQDLQTIKFSIFELVKSGSTIGQVYVETDRLLKELSYENCHQMYPLGVLGHKVGFLPFQGFPRLNVLGFHPQALFYLLKQDATALFKVSKNSPFVEEKVREPFSPGLWSFEPHIGAKTFGVKFEEILVVPEHARNAFWLSDYAPEQTS